MRGSRKRKSSKPIAGPASPTSYDEDLRRLEAEAIRQYTYMVKQSDPEKGTTISNAISLRLREIEPHVVRGKKIKASAKVGHEKLYGTPDQKQTQRQKMRDKVSELHAAHPQWSWEEIKRGAASHLGCSSKTIARYVPNPKKS